MTKRTLIGTRGAHWELRIFRIMLLKLAFVLFSALALAQSDLAYNFHYKCNRETLIVAYCRHDSDMAGYPPTTPDRDYCLVYYPDRPMRGGFTVQTSELRGDIIKKLQACGVLARSEEAAQSEPETPSQSATSSMTADDYIKQAEPYYHGKDAAKAIEPLKKSISITPSAAAYNDLGIAYTNLNRYSDASSAFEQAARLDPSNAYVRLNLGFSYLKLKKYESGIAALRESLRLKPLPDAADQLGLAFEDLGRYSEAIAAFKQTIHIDPTFSAAYSNLGDLSVRMNKLDDALAAYRQLQKLSQDDADELYMEIIRAETDAKPKPSATERAKSYANLGIAALLAKANAGDDAAMKRLSDAYYAQHDTLNGLKWEIKAAEHGDPELQNELGWRYANGSGATKNLTEARAWYRKAGEQGFDTAELNLCQSYAAELNLDDGVLSGAGKDNLQSPIVPLQGSKADIDDAFTWCERGGSRGMYLAAWFAGVLNARGSATHPPNYSDAYFWLIRGDLPAGAAFRQKVANHVTDAQRTEIEQRAAKFAPDPLELYHQMMLKKSAQQQ